MSPQGDYPLSDLALSRRLEGAEARSNAAFVEARAEVFPDSGAEWIEVAGASAMFDGVASPLTQTFGLGMLQPVTSSDLDVIEGFFKERGAPVFHEISPLADPALLSLLKDRRYHPIELTSVMHRPLQKGGATSVTADDEVQVRRAGPGEEDLWAATAAKGWSEFGSEIVDFVMEVGEINKRRPEMLSFLAEKAGRPIAAAAMVIGERIGLLAGASTIPEGRRQGAQQALLNYRLRYAAEQGCDIAMMCALPGSASQRNAERHGFRIAYTRIKWQLG